MPPLDSQQPAITLEEYETFPEEMAHLTSLLRLSPQAMHPMTMSKNFTTTKITMSVNTG